MVEVLLQLLVAIVDAELLEAIDLEPLKPENVCSARSRPERARAATGNHGQRRACCTSDDARARRGPSTPSVWTMPCLAVSESLMRPISQPNMRPYMCLASASRPVRQARRANRLIPTATSSKQRSGCTD